MFFNFSFYILLILIIYRSESNSIFSAYNGYVAKIDINTGELIWDFDFKTSSGTRSGFETIHFTSDGGFIVGGFSHRADVEMPGFKSGGQVDQGRPVMHKFSAQVASSASVSNPCEFKI